MNTTQQTASIITSLLPNEQNEQINRQINNNNLLFNQNQQIINDFPSTIGDIMFEENLFR